MAMARSSCPKNVVIEQIKAWQSRKKIFNRRQPLLSDWHATDPISERTHTCCFGHLGRGPAEKMHHDGLHQEVQQQHVLCTPSLFGPGTFSICCCSVNGPFTWDVCQGRVHSAVMHGQTERARWGQATRVVTVISWLQCTHSPFSGQEQPHAVLDYSVMWSRGRWLYDTCKVLVNVSLNIFFWSAE